MCRFHKTVKVMEFVCLTYQQRKCPLHKKTSLDTKLFQNSFNLYFSIFVLTHLVVELYQGSNVEFVHSKVFKIWTVLIIFKVKTAHTVSRFVEVIKDR